MVIVVNMFGGLGGQMFQYALGRHLALKNHDILKVDTISFDGTGRQFELGNYNITAMPATVRERLNMRTHPFLAQFMTKSGHVKEKKPFDYDPNILSMKGDVYLDGYWADERYFKDIANTIHKDFTPKQKPELSVLNCKYPVAVHFRRTDYPNEIGAEYYIEAIHLMQQQYPDAIFFVFSDGDIIPSEFGIPAEQCVNLSVSRRRPFEDMYLISKCKHHILSNSTFAWWGAWLGKSEGQTVFTPATWFLDRPTPDTLCPEEWIRIQNSIHPRVQEKLK